MDDQKLNSANVDILDPRQQEKHNIYIYKDMYIYIYKSIGNIIKLNTDSGAFQAMLDSLGTLLGMGAGAAESELAMREEHFKVRGNYGAGDLSS